MGTTLMVVAGFCGLNEVLFLVSSHFGMPTAIAGLGWALDHAVLGSPVFQVVGTLVGFAVSFLYDPNNETVAALSHRAGQGGSTRQARTDR
jgi:F0F1-type ATP synthase assembly protein I